MRDTARQSGAVKAKTESQELVKANTGRMSLYVSNDGEKAVYLSFGEKAKAKEGLRLNKESPPFKLEDYRGSVSVITAEGESVVTFLEV